MFSNKKNDEYKSEIEDYKEYKVMKENIKYLIIFYKKEEEIVIKCMNYFKTLNLNDLSTIFNNSINSITTCFNHINNRLDENKIHIKNHTEKIIKLILEINKNNQTEINLIYQENNILNISLLSDITTDSYMCFFNNTFLVFKSFDNLNYLIYTSQNYSIICFDLFNMKKII